MKRAGKCVHEKMIHIEFENDYIKFTFEKEKGKQHGDIYERPMALLCQP